MRKLLLSLVVIAVLVIVFLPFGMGFVAKKQFTKFVDGFAHTPNVTLEVKDYQRGWWKSTADVVVKLSDHRGMANNMSNITLVLHETILHGPLIFDKSTTQWGLALAKGELEASDDVRTLLKDVIPAGQEFPKLNSELLFKLGGGVQATLRLPSFSMGKPGEGQLVWQGMQANWDFSAGMKEVQGDIVLEAFKLTTPTASIEQDTMTLTYQLHDADGLWVGQADFDYPRLSVVDNKKQQFLVSGVKVKSASNIADQLLGGTINVGVDMWRYNDLQYGPGKFVMAINKLDAATMLTIKQKLEAANAPNVTDQQRQLVFMTALSHLPKLLDKGAELQIHTLNLKTPEGMVRANAQLSLQQSETNAKGGRNVFAMLKRVQAKANIEAPVPLVTKMFTQTTAKKIKQKQVLKAVMAQHRQQPKPDTQTGDAKKAAPASMLSEAQIQQQASQQAVTQLAQWEKDGMLIKNGNVYKINISYENNQLMINGKSMTQQRSQGRMQKPQRSNAVAH